MRARRRAARRCAPQSAPAPGDVLELLRAVEVDEEGEACDPLLETPDIFEPEADIEFEFEFEAGSQSPLPAPTSLARALAVAVGVEEACEANDNAETEFVTAPQTAPQAGPVAAPHTAPVIARAAANPPSQQVVESEDEDAPFDAPDADDEIFQTPKPHARRWSDPADVLELHTPAPPSFPHEPSDLRPPARPAPAIAIHVNWDRAAGADLAEKLSAEPLLARADISDARGGIAGAAAQLAKVNAPDLLILETTLKAEPLLEAIDALQAALGAATKLFIVGDVNDVTLVRDLARRGIIHYFLAPADPAEIARAICDLHADVDRSRVVAVVGSRGGAGASAIAHNLAWSLAERHDASTTLIELDIAFGTTAFSFDQRASHSVVEGVRDPQAINETFLDRVGVMQTERLRLVAAPATLGDVVALERPAAGALIRHARRLSKVVVLDVPHHWDTCIKDILERANDVLIVATPDLASLRNTKNLLDALKSLRPAGHEPLVLLSMVGASKTSEISEKDFAGAIDSKPIMAFEFDPALFAGAALRRQMLSEAAPQSPAARQIDELAALLTGRKLVKRRKSARKEAQQRSPVEREATSGPAPVATQEVPIPAPLKAPAEAHPVTSLTARPVKSLTAGLETRLEAKTENQIILELTETLLTDNVAPSPLPGQHPKRRSRPRRLSRHQCQPMPLPKRRAAQPGTLRLTAALMALLAASMWYAEKRADIDFIGYAISSPR